MSKLVVTRLCPTVISRSLSFLVRGDVDELATAFSFSEKYYTVHKSIDCVVFAHAYIQSRVVHSAALALDDVAGFSVLSTENLNSQSFAF